jgi:V/A-type H+-transporting ATPase subunit I
VIINNFLRNNGGINPIVAMLGFAVFIGLLHIFTGLIINISNTVTIKNPSAALFELNWVIFLFALLSSFIGVVGFSSILGISFPLLIASTVGLFLLNNGKGISGKILGGFIKLYDIVAFIADMLSYTRLIAVGLTGSIIATVINLLASIAYQGSGPILGVFAVILILLIGG